MIRRNHEISQVRAPTRARSRSRSLSLPLPPCTLQRVSDLEPFNHKCLVSDADLCISYIIHRNTENDECRLSCFNDGQGKINDIESVALNRRKT